MKYLVAFILLQYNLVLLAQSGDVRDENYRIVTERDSDSIYQPIESQDNNSRDTSYTAMRAYEKYCLFVKPIIGGDDADQSFNYNLIPSQISVVSYDLAPVHIGLSIGVVLSHFKKTLPDQNKTCLGGFPGSCFMAYSYAPNCVEHYIGVHYIYYYGSNDSKDNQKLKIKNNDIELNGVEFKNMIYECNEIGIDYGVNIFGFFFTLGLSYTNEKNSISFSVQNTERINYEIGKNGYKSVVFKYGIDCNWVYIQGQYIFNKHNQFYQTQNAVSIGTGFPLWFLQTKP